MMPTRIDVETLDLDQVGALLEKGAIVPADAREELQERLRALGGLGGPEESPRPSGG